MGWLATTRSILEILYFASGIAIAIFAFLGLKQIQLGLEQLRITKEIAKKNAKREGVKLAAEQCRYYAEECVRTRQKVIIDYNQKGFKFLSARPNQPPFVIQNGEITSHNFDLKALTEEMPKSESMIHYMNTLEAFAIPFAAGLADEDVGYGETARAFCRAVAEVMPVLFQLRRTEMGRFESTLKLYEMWRRRLDAEAALPVIEKMGEVVKKGGERIKPLDHDF
jgi:hypothetical protein